LGYLFDFGVSISLTIFGTVFVLPNLGKPCGCLRYPQFIHICSKVDFFRYIPRVRANKYHARNHELPVCHIAPPAQKANKRLFVFPVWEKTNKRSFLYETARR
jgi:hypothetical protein